MKPTLTPRQQQITQMLVAGMSSRDIAARCGIVVQVVKNYSRAVYRLYGVHSRWELARKIVPDTVEALRIENRRLVEEIKRLQKANRVLKGMM